MAEPISKRLSQRQLYEQAWSEHDPALHPEALQLHMERRLEQMQVLTFREMCGESAFIPPSELTTIRKIGSGSFAKVEICRYQPPGKQPETVAVKRLNSNTAFEIASFASEANILRKLHHPNIVGYIGVGSMEESELVKDHTKSACYMVQEFVDGGTLKQKVWRQASLIHPIYSDHDAVQWCKQIAEGLAYLHSANPLVLHRDMKLENILLKNVNVGAKRPKFVAKICDFGLAVSLLDPHFGYRHMSGMQPQSPPAGLSTPRIGNHFHEQMTEHLKGNSITHPKIAAHSERMDLKLSQMSAQPSFKLDKDAMTRGTPITAEAQSPMGPRSSKSLRSAMSRRFSQSSLSASAQQTQPESPVAHEAYNLTGRAGSYVYMAPEVVMCTPYNEKVDIFSMGVIIFEVFLRKTMAAVILQDDSDPSEVEMFAYKEPTSLLHLHGRETQVAGGYRHPIPKDWPQELQQLISEAWAQNPDKRPTAAELARRLAKLEDSELFRKWEDHHPQGSSDLCNCCSVQ